MKKKNLSIGVLFVAAAGLSLVCGCVVEPNGRLAFQPLVVEAPAPVVYAPGPAMVPDEYVWDGYENVGYIGGQYYYLGAGNVWIVADPYRLDRFHGWERGHADWRNHATRNDNFRRDSWGHVQPRQDRARH